MAKKVIYTETFYNAGAVQYTKDTEYPEDDNSDRHVKSGIAEYVKEKALTKAEKEAAEKQAAADQALADAAAAELAKNQAAEASAVEIKVKAIELSGLTAEDFEALVDETKRIHIEAAAAALAE